MQILTFGEEEAGQSPSPSTTRYPSLPTSSPLLSLLPTQSSSHFRSQYTGKKKQPITETGSLLDSYSYINSCCLKENLTPSPTLLASHFSPMVSCASVMPCLGGRRVNTTCQGPREAEGKTRPDRRRPALRRDAARSKVGLVWKRRRPTPANGRRF